MKHYIIVAATLLLCTVGALSQSLPKDVPLPPINAGPGRTVSVKSVVKHYNFWGMKREVPLPWERIIMQPAELPDGVKIVSTIMSPSKQLVSLSQDPSSVLRGVEPPQRKEVQHFKGKNSADNGTIVYMQWNTSLPADMRERLAKLFYNANERPDGPQLVEFICNDNTLIIWAFTKHESIVKQTHQENVFTIVSELADKMFPPQAQPPGNH